MTSNNVTLKVKSDLSNNLELTTSQFEWRRKYFPFSVIKYCWMGKVKNNFSNSYNSVPDSKTVFKRSLKSTRSGLVFSRLFTDCLRLDEL